MDIFGRISHPLLGLKNPTKEKQKILADAKRCCSGRGEKDSKMKKIKNK